VETGDVAEARAKGTRCCDGGGSGVGAAFGAQPAII
jgi:hypothetical protein